MVDVIFLAKTKTTASYRMTQNAILTCKEGAGDIPIDITVVEQQDGVSYPDATMIYKSEPFHFNRFANEAIHQSSSEWFVIANTDLLFKPGWLGELLAANYPIVSPANPGSIQNSLNTNTVGSQNGLHFSGWCFMMSRWLYDQIGGFDECVNFWCSDDVVVEQTTAAGYPPMLVPGSKVAHLVSKTLLTVPKRDDLTWKQVHIFNQKYGRDKFADHPQYLSWKRRNNL